MHLQHVFGPGIDFTHLQGTVDSKVKVALTSPWAET